MVVSSPSFPTTFWYTTLRIDEKIQFDTLEPTVRDIVGSPPTAVMKHWVDRELEEAHRERIQSVRDDVGRRVELRREERDEDQRNDQTELRRPWGELRRLVEALLRLRFGAGISSSTPSRHEFRSNCWRIRVSGYDSTCSPLVTLRAVNDACPLPLKRPAEYIFVLAFLECKNVV